MFPQSSTRLNKRDIKNLTWNLNYLVGLAGLTEIQTIKVAESVVYAYLTGKHKPKRIGSAILVGIYNEAAANPEMYSNLRQSGLTNVVGLVSTYLDAVGELEGCSDLASKLKEMVWKKISPSSEDEET